MCSLNSINNSPQINRFKGVKFSDPNNKLGDNNLNKIYKKNKQSLIHQSRRLKKLSKITPIAPRLDIAVNTKSKRVLASSSEAPLFHVSFDAHGQAEICLARKAPPIKKLILQGGGAKGVVYPSFLIELERKQPGFIANLDAVAGTSAGSMMAFLLAAGVPLKELEEFVQNVNTLTLMWGEKTDATRAVNLNKDGLMSGLKLRQTLHEISIKPAQEFYLEHIKDNPVMQDAIRNQYGGISFLQRAESGFKKGITFNDLKILHAVHPVKFKPLHVTAFDKNAKTIIYFDGDNPKTRHVPCFQAVGASLSIPLVFRSVNLKLEGETSARTFQDGGVGSNAPIEIFAKNRPEEKMLLHFDGGGTAQQILHDPGVPVNKCKAFSLNKVATKIVGIFKSLLSNLRRQGAASHICRRQDPSLWYGPRPSAIKVLVAGSHFEENQRQDAEKIHNLALNAVVVPHDGLGSLSFAAFKSTKRQAIAAARRAARAHVDRLDGAGVSRTYISVQHALASLSLDEIKGLKAIAHQHIAAGEEFLASILEQNCSDEAYLQRQVERNRLEKEFYTAIINWKAEVS